MGVEEEPTCAEFPICDFCIHYRFNPGPNGEYLDRGECAHPYHTGPRDPSDSCENFFCEICNPAPERTI